MLKKINLISWWLMCSTTYIIPISVAAADIRIGYVNPIKVLEASPQAEEARKQLEREFAPRDRKLVATQKQIKQMEDRLAKDGAIMSEGERQSLERKIIDGKRELRRDQDEFREDLNYRRNEEFGKLQKQIFEAVQAVGKEEGYDMIVGEGVIYANERVDVTAKVVERLKKQYRIK